MGNKITYSEEGLYPKLEISVVDKELLIHLENSKYDEYLSYYLSLEQVEQLKQFLNKHF